MSDCLWVTQDDELGAQSPRELIHRPVSLRPVRIETTAVRHPYECLINTIDEAFSWWAFQPGRSNVTASVEAQCEENDEDRSDSRGTNVSDTQEDWADCGQNSNVVHGS